MQAEENIISPQNNNILSNRFHDVLYRRNLTHLNDYATKARKRFTSNLLNKIKSGNNADLE